MPAPSSLPKPSLLPPRSRVQDRLGPLFRGRGQDPKPVPFKSQSKLDGFLSRQGAGCLRLTAGTDNPFVLDLEELADGDTYSMVANEYSGFAGVKRGLDKVEGRLRTDAAILENDVSALSPHAELLPDPPPTCARATLLPLLFLSFISPPLALPLFGVPFRRELIWRIS